MIRAVVVAAMLALATTAMADSVRIVALGDMPYGEPEQVYPPYERLISKINALDAELVIHIGDTMGGTPCSDTALAEQLFYLNSFRAPLLYTPGDNEWTDCHRRSSGGFDPRERLSHIRETYFSDPATSFGVRQQAVAHQGADGYPENARLMLGDIAVITAHVVGSNNGFEIHDPAAAEEFFARNAATIDWLEDSFVEAAAAEAIIVAIHADMFEFGFNTWKRERWLRHSGFGQFGEALKAAAVQYEKPVLLIFGDSHRYRVFHPMTNTAPNLLAMEVYGYPQMHAVEVMVDTSAPNPFTFRPIVNANR